MPMFVSTKSHEELLARQQQLEDEGLAEGARRFKRRIEQAAQAGRASQVGGARKLVQMAIDPLADALAQLTEQSRGRPGRKHQVEKLIHQLGPETLAYMTVKTVLDSFPRRSVLRFVAQKIAQTATDELIYRRFQEQAPELFNYRMERFNTSSYAHKSRSLDAAIRWAEIETEDLELPMNVKLIVGVKLIDMLIETTQLAKVEQHRKIKGRSKIQHETFLVPTTETLDWIATRNGLLEMTQPVCMPMVVPPLPWRQGVTRGSGYRFALRFTQPLVRGITKSHVETIKQQDMPVVYEAINAIQDTPWTINQRVLALVQEIVERGGGMAGIPDLTMEDEPTRPANIATDKAVRKAWRKLAHGVKERNHQRKLNALVFHKKHSVALALKDDEAIYFPCNLDFRGRVYPVTHYLTPQGDDLCKSLLTFAEGKPLGNEGAVYLALHGANCLGTTPDGVKLSKATLQERVDWIVSHTTDIEAVAADPLAHRWWCEDSVDEPLQFFAFCVEWAAYAQLSRAGRGEEYVSHLPCAVDGTCNGLQHFAAMFRDPIGGAAVNVVPSERPQDVYQRIADAVLARLEPDAGDLEEDTWAYYCPTRIRPRHGKLKADLECPKCDHTYTEETARKVRVPSRSTLARLWLQHVKIDRKLTKRPTMTFGYGSKKYGFAEQIEKFIHEQPDAAAILAGMTDADGDSLLRPACTYMSSLIWDALQEVVVSASHGMEWMQECARLVAQQGTCVEWTVPGTNFAVRQEYHVQTKHEVATILAGKSFRPMVFKDTAKPNPYKQANAVAPNIVHSLDAAALMLTVQRCRAAGISTFAMIHDSYGTHAANGAALAASLREAFIDLYTNDVVAGLAIQFWKQAGTKTDKLPEPPAAGALDLNAVKESPYFFA